MRIWRLVIRIIGLLVVFLRATLGQVRKLPRLTVKAGSSGLKASASGFKYFGKFCVISGRAMGQGAKWGAKKLWHWKKVFLISFLLVVTFTAFLLSPSLQRVTYELLFNPLMVGWTLAILLTITAKLVMPATIGKKGKEVRNIFWPLPVLAMAIVTPFWLVWSIFTSFIPKWLIPSWQSVMMCVGGAIGVALLFIIGRVLIKGTVTDEARKQKATEVLMLALSLTVALGVINWLLWVLDGEFWGSVWATPSRFWAINLGILLAILLLFVAKGADGKPHPVAKILSWVIGSLVATILIVSFWDFMTEGKGWSLWAGKLGDMVSRTQSRVDNKSHSAPMEVALAIIADCESGGGVPGAATHFEKDGKTPLKNKEGSTAIGKYQILASAHEKRAKEMGFDITTEADNEAYARVLYQESGTRHWEADARSKACWEPKLRAYTWGSEEVSLVVVAPLDRESGVIPTPQKNGGGKFDLSGGGKKYQVRWNVGMPSETLETLPRAKDAPRLQPDVVYNLALKSAEKEPVSVVVKFY